MTALIEMSPNYEDPKLVCNLVMKGGITSGIVYPPVVDELAKNYRFDHIGGASAGAGKRDKRESGTGPILLSWAAPPTFQRSSPGRGILISAHLSRAPVGR